MFRPAGGLFAAAGFGAAAEAAVAEAPLDNGRNSQPMSISQAFGEVLLRVMESADPGEDRAELAALIAEIDAMRKSVEARVEARKSARVANLSSQHAEVYAAARQALDRLRDLQQQRGRSNSNLNVLAQRLGDARAGFETMQALKPSLDSFPSDDELANWSRAFAIAQQQFAATEEEFRLAKVQANTLEHEFGESAKALEQLKEQESALRGQARF